MPTLTLSRPVPAPEGDRAEFRLPETATLGLLRGLKLPVETDAGGWRIVLDGSQAIQLLVNLLALPPAYAERFPLDLLGEVWAAAGPLLPARWRAFLTAGSATPAS